MVKQGFGVAFWIWDSPQSAQNERDDQGKSSQETPRQGSFGGETIGDSTYRWGERNQPDDETVIVYDRLLHMFCYYDRVVIEVTDWWEDRNPSAEDTKWLDTIAWDAFYRLLNHPKQIVPAIKLPVVVEGQSTDQTATMLGNVAVAPVAVLERAGAQLESQQTDNRRSWRPSLGQRWVKLVPQRRRLTTSSGEVQLRRPVISHRGILIVPLEAIGQALGFRVEVEGRTRVLVSREGGG